MAQPQETLNMIVALHKPHNQAKPAANSTTQRTTTTPTTTPTTTTTTTNNNNKITTTATINTKFCQAQPKPQPANPQLGAEIAFFSQLWGTYTSTIHQHQHPE